MDLQTGSPTKGLEVIVWIGFKQNKLNITKGETIKAQDLAISG
jgi:hypothetical protein